MTRPDSLPVAQALLPSKPGYPSLLDLALRQGRRVVLVGGTVAALSGGTAGCDAAKDADTLHSAELPGYETGIFADVPIDEGVAQPYDIPAGTDVGSLPDVPLDTPLEVPDTFIVPDPGGTMDLGWLPDAVNPESSEPDAIVPDAPLPPDDALPVDPDAAGAPESSR